MRDVDPSIKVVFLGESGSGKTSIINRYIDKSFSPLTSPTIGCFGRTVPYEYRDQTYNLNLWDTAGQEIYRSLTPMYYRNSNAAIVVFDVTNHDSFNQLEGWITELVSNIGATVVLIVCGNKADLIDQRVVKEVDAEAFSQTVHAIYLETSALSGDGLDFLFHTVVRASVDKGQDSFAKPITGPAGLEAAEETGGCC
jgi:small GTP-binding protein